MLSHFRPINNELPDYGHPWNSAENAPYEVQRDLFYGLVNRDFRETSANIYTGRIEFAPTENITLNSVTRYGKTGNAYVVTAPERPDITDPNPANWTLSANPKNRNPVNEYIANQTAATIDLTTGGLEHTIVAGFEMTREDIENRVVSQFEILGLLIPISGPSHAVENPAQHLGDFLHPHPFGQRY